MAPTTGKLVEVGSTRDVRGAARIHRDSARMLIRGAAQEGAVGIALPLRIQFGDEGVDTAAEAAWTPPNTGKLVGLRVARDVGVARCVDGNRGAQVVSWFRPDRC